MLEKQEVSSTRKEIIPDWVFVDEGVNVVNPLTVKYCGGAEQALVGLLKARCAERMAANANRKCAAITIASAQVYGILDEAEIKCSVKDCKKGSIDLRPI